MLFWFGVLLPETDFSPIIHEWVGEVKHETDFTKEAANQAQIAGLLSSLAASNHSHGCVAI